MNAVSFDCCGGCVPLGPDQSVQDVIDIHLTDCDARQRLTVLAEHRDDMYREVAIMHDVDVKRQNQVVDDMEPYPLVISGDALALHKEKHP